MAEVLSQSEIDALLSAHIRDIHPDELPKEKRNRR